MHGRGGFTQFDGGSFDNYDLPGAPHPSTSTFSLGTGCIAALSATELQLNRLNRSPLLVTPQRPFVPAPGGLQLTWRSAAVM